MMKNIIDHMVQILIQIDDELSRRLEEVAPARSRERSEFIRAAIRKALWEREERATEEAYRRQPDSRGAYLEPRAWEAREASPKYRRRRR
jgi:Arc/MetJ-type ribon-helix-helix transcriptional regulator